MRFVLLTDDGAAVEINQDGDTLRARIGDAVYDVAWQERDGGALLLRIDGRLHTAVTAGRDGILYVWLDGRAYALRREEQRARRRAGERAAGSLSATMPGQVIAVAVTPGRQVQRGQTLVVLEAMKMEQRITAPEDGVVAAVHCAVGDVVERGQVVVEIGETRDWRLGDLRIRDWEIGD